MNHNVAKISSVPKLCFQESVELGWCVGLKKKKKSIITTWLLYQFYILQGEMIKEAAIMTWLKELQVTVTAVLSNFQHIVKVNNAAASGSDLSISTDIQ